MNVRHDRSYISENSRDLIGRGYAAEVLDTLRFRFTYTQVERDANRSRAQTQPYADGIAERAKAAMLRACTGCSRISFRMPSITACLGAASTSL